MASLASLCPTTTTSLSKAGVEHTLQQERIESPTPPPLIYLVTPREGEQLPDLARSDLVCALGAQAFTRHRRECPRRESLHELPQWHKGSSAPTQVGPACVGQTTSPQHLEPGDPSEIPPRKIQKGLSGAQALCL